MSEIFFTDGVSCIKHPLIKPNTVQQRLYQLDLAGKALKGPSLVVLPTGLGKTVIALFVIASRLQRFGGKALVLSPTKPLVEQHAAFFKRVMQIPEKEVLTFTGSLAPAKRQELWKTGKLIVSTPQAIENDILTKRISLETVTHITFDEAHRAVGNYAYTYIAEKYFETAKNPHVLGITASPGSTNEKISEVCEALRIENVAIKTEGDRDVSPYVQEKEIEWVKVGLPEEMAKIRDDLAKIVTDRLEKIKVLGFSFARGKYVSKKELLSLQKSLQGELREGGNPAVFTALSLVAEVMKVNHAVELVETQGLEALKKYLEKLDAEASSKGASKASRRLMGDLYMRKVLHSLKIAEAEHPKLECTQAIVAEQLEENPDSRVIVFTNYRDTAEMVAKALAEVSEIFPVRFVGQSSRYKDKGLSQKQQVEIIKKFREGEYNVLVATSVAEEGLDIPSTDLVLFYEPIPSEIRSIQRKGRTGRQHRGRVVVLLTKGTRDEAYYWSSKNKEKRMLKNMQGLQESLAPKKSAKSAFSEPEILTFEGEEEKRESNEREKAIFGRVSSSEKQRTLKDFKFSSNEGQGGKKSASRDLKVLVDHRETRSGVAKALDRLGLQLRFAALEVGDYVVSDRVAVERKRTDDFASSLVDGKRNLFSQLSNLARVYGKPVLIIEGDELFTARQLAPAAIHGALASIALDFGISILYSRDEEETASILKVLANREQFRDKREVNPHGKKAAGSLAEQQEYLVSSISNIGPKAARNLLLHFGTVEALLRAEPEELKKVKLIGPKTAARILEVVKSPYKG